MILRPVISLPLLLLLGACANVPMASPQQDAEAKRFESPPSDSGAVYIYRQGWFGVARPLGVAIAGGVQAELASNTYLRLEGPPGPIDIDCRIGDKTDRREVEVVAGQTRYVEVAMRVGLLAPSCEVAEVSADQGQSAVRSSKRVTPQ